MHVLNFMALGIDIYIDGYPNFSWIYSLKKNVFP